MTDSHAPVVNDGTDYLGRILSLLGSQDPLTVMARTAESIREKTETISENNYRLIEAPGKWSVLNVVQHLAHTEVALGFRYRQVLAEEGGVLPAIDQNRWVSGLYPDDVTISDALEDFAALRGVNLRLLQHVKPDEWTRYGLHSQRGKETLGQMLRLYAAHDLYHLGQIERIIAVVGA